MQLLDNIGFRANSDKQRKIFFKMISKNMHDLVLIDCQMPILEEQDAAKQLISLVKYQQQ